MPRRSRRVAAAGQRDGDDDREQNRQHQGDELAEEESEQEQTSRQKHRAIGDVRARLFTLHPCPPTVPGRR
jgi:hypothetical protein